MKKIAGFLLIWAISAGLQAQTVFDPMESAVKAGSAKELVRFLNSSIDINIEGDINPYSKTQAEFVLRDFFKKHTPTDFSIVHKGASKGGLQFAIGKYQSGTDNYTVVIRVREVGKEYLIHEISFVKE